MPCAAGGGAKAAWLRTRYPDTVSAAIAGVSAVVGPRAVACAAVSMAEGSMGEALLGGGAGWSDNENEGEAESEGG